MGLVEHAGEVAVLPEMADPAAAGVHTLCVTALQVAKELGQRILPFWDDDPMNVIGHKTPCQNPHLGQAQQRTGKSEIGGPIAFLKEDTLAVNSPLSDVVGRSWFETSSISGHLRKSSGCALPKFSWFLKLDRSGYGPICPFSISTASV